MIAKILHFLNDNDGLAAWAQFAGAMIAIALTGFAASEARKNAAAAERRSAADVREALQFSIDALAKAAAETPRIATDKNGFVTDRMAAFQRAQSILTVLLQRTITVKQIRAVAAVSSLLEEAKAVIRQVSDDQLLLGSKTYRPDLIRLHQCAMDEANDLKDSPRTRPRLLN
jgi:hypothetical protein